MRACILTTDGSAARSCLSRTVSVAIRQDLFFHNAHATVAALTLILRLFRFFVDFLGQLSSNVTKARHSHASSVKSLLLITQFFVRKLDFANMIAYSVS